MMNIPKPGPGEALLLDPATGAWRIVPRSAIPDTPIASITVPEHQLDEAVERVMRLLNENEE
jgi:hypothetical protein